MQFRILEDNLPERVKKALEDKASGDWEVLSYIAENDLANEYVRVVNGEDEVLRADCIKAAIESKFEIRP